jgi:hypothetical protein
MTAPKKKTGFLGWIENHAKGLEQGALGAGLLLAPEIVAPIFGTYEIYKSLHSSSPKTKQTKPKTSTSSSTSGSGTTIPWKQTAPFTGGYVYNAPMVDNAIFNPTPISTDDGVFGQVDLQAYQNAKNAWTTKDGKVHAAKGAFQMDRYLWKSSAAMQITASLKKQGKPVPTQMNGFKFLYNPQTVAMTWGQTTFTNNQALLQGLDSIVPAAPGSTNSSISFWIPLNRMQDANYLNPDGSYLWSDDKFTQATDSINYNINQINKTLGGKGNLPITPKLPYSYDVPIAERKAVYEKGTMYDVEWLMKTINGWAFLDHTSDVSGLKTNDMGFLLQFPVELHLGNSLRYRVQVTDISVNHIIFNSRMIPIWSTVNITCRRFPEYNFSDISKTLK